MNWFVSEVLPIPLSPNIATLYGIGSLEVSVFSDFPLSREFVLLTRCLLLKIDVLVISLFIALSLEFTLFKLFLNESPRLTIPSFEVVLNDRFQTTQTHNLQMVTISYFFLVDQRQCLTVLVLVSVWTNIRAHGEPKPDANLCSVRADSASTLLATFAS